MCSRYGANTREKLNRFKLGELDMLMEYDRQDRLALVSQIDMLLSIPRQMMNVQLKGSNEFIRSMKQSSKKIRDSLYTKVKKRARTRTTPGESIFQMTVADVEQKFGVKFMEGPNV